MEILGVAHWDDVEIGCLYLDQGEVGHRVGTNDCRREVTVVVEGDFELIGLLYHMVVGDDVAVAADYHSRAEAYLTRLRLLLLRLPGLLGLASRRAEEKFEKRIVEIAVGRRHARLTGSGITFHADHAVDSLLGRIGEIILIYHSSSTRAVALRWLFSGRGGVGAVVSLAGIGRADFDCGSRCHDSCGCK